MRSAFTLLEVVIALGILSVSLFVLVSLQTTSVLMTSDSEAILTGTYLAHEKMAEAMLGVEREGFKTADVEEEGDFEDFGEEGDFGEDSLGLSGDFEGYKWAYTIREVDLSLGDLSGAADTLEAAGVGPNTTGEDESDQQEPPDLGDMGLTPDMIGDMLKPYIREVRVVVWWGAEDYRPDKECVDCVEFVTHLVNPSGTLVAGSEEGS